MTRYLRIVLSLLTLLVLPVSLYAATPAAPVTAPAVSQQTAIQPYVPPDILPPTLLPPPPAEGSPEWRQDADAVIQAQQNIAPDDLIALRDEQHLRLSLMSDVIGLDFIPARFPVTFAFLERVKATSDGIAEADKQYWHTRRPYLTDPQVKLQIDPIDASPAYPSGHTCETAVLAEVLGMLYPAKLDDLRAKAQLIALHRVEAGVHYPGDIMGGRRLAMLVTGALLNDDAFRRDLAAAQAEIAAQK